MCVDLHVHSLYSDGTNTPKELLDQALKLKLSAVALTDHDTVDGVEEAIHYGRKHGIMVFSGLEVSASNQDTSLHILGYGVNHKHEGLKNWLVPIQRGREKRNRTIIKKLQQQNIDIQIEELERFSHCGQTGRPHIARLLVHKNVTRTMEQAFQLYLRRGRPAWAERFAYSAAETIAMIHRAGGIAVLAHPGLLDPGFTMQPRLVAELAEYGLDGLEAYYQSHSIAMRQQLLKLADKHQMIVTGGSDFHGTTHNAKEMAGGRNGFCPPDSIIQDINTRMRENHALEKNAEA